MLVTTLLNLFQPHTSYVIKCLQQYHCVLIQFFNSSLKISFIFNMWPVSSITSSGGGSGTTPYRPFEPSFDDFRPNPFPSPEPPAPPPTSLSPPLNLNLGGTNWSLSPPADDRDSIDTDTVRYPKYSTVPGDQVKLSIRGNQSGKWAVSHTIWVSSATIQPCKSEKVF